MYLAAAQLSAARLPSLAPPRPQSARGGRARVGLITAPLALVAGVITTMLVFHVTRESSASAAAGNLSQPSDIVAKHVSPALELEARRAIDIDAIEAAADAESVDIEPRRADALPQVSVAREPARAREKKGSGVEAVASEPDAVAAPVAPFDRDAAKTALAEAAAQAAQCGTGGTDADYARVAVTFVSSGKATLAVVEGDSPIRGTAAGSCVAAAMRSARVPAFSGERVTVRQTISLAR